MLSKSISFIKEQLKDIKDERNKTDIAETVDFAKKHKSHIIFSLNLKTDTMTACYKDKYMSGRTVSKYLKRKTGLVKNIVLGHGDTKKRSADIDIFGNFIKEFLWQISDKIGDPAENAKRQDEELDEKVGVINQNNK